MDRGRSQAPSSIDYLALVCHIENHMLKHYDLARHVYDLNTVLKINICLRSVT